MPWSSAHERTAASLPALHTNGPSSVPWYVPSSLTRYWVAITSSRPSRSASGLTMSYGVVVAITTGRPAARCSSNSAAASGWIISSSCSAATAAAACTASCDLPFAKATAWRANAIDGSVSPMVLNSRNSSASPGMERLTNPAVFIAAENTSPDAPASSVRSRSKKAAPVPPGPGWLRSPCRMRRGHQRDCTPKREKPRLGEAGSLNQNPVIGGTTLGGSFERNQLGVGTVRLHVKVCT